LSDTLTVILTGCTSQLINDTDGQQGLNQANGRKDDGIGKNDFQCFPIQWVWLSGDPLYLMLGLVALTMAIIILLPRLTKAVPSSLVAIVGVSYQSAHQ
jgi:hypothetical protein